MLTRTILRAVSAFGVSLLCSVAGCDGSSGEISGSSGNGGSSGKGGSGTGGTGATGGSGQSGSGGTGGSGQSGSGGTGTGGKGGTGGSAGKGGTGGVPQQANSVLQHHNHANRDGVYVDSKFTRVAAKNLHADTTFAGAALAGPTYAQPLYLAGAGGKPDLVIVATEQNHVYGFNAATGAKVWDRTLAPALSRGDLNCGNIDPVGVTGTPVIDEATRTIYLDTMTSVNSAPHHIVWAVDADTGTPRNWKADLSEAGLNVNSVVFDAKPQNQRGALALLGGFVFVPFGGHAGDCDLYHGWIIGISTSNATQIRAWNTRAIAGGIWAPAGIASDGTSLYFATGNTQQQTNNFAAPGNWGDGESLFRLTTSLNILDGDFFAPEYWKDLDNSDTDISGTAPVLFELAGKSYLMGLGKDGKAYLVDRTNMGHFSGTALVIKTVAGGGIINAAATYKTPLGTYVVFRGSGSNCPGSSGGGLTAIKISDGSPPTIGTAWCAGPGTRKSPAVTMVDGQGNDAIVWIVGDDNKLYGLNGDTGATIFGGGVQGDAMAGVASFQTPIIVKGRVFVAGDRVYAFSLP
jgi:hypothetical protein